MSHFYGTLQGMNRGKTSRATRCGAKSSALTVQAASWAGAIETRVYHDEESGQDMYEVRQIPWHGAGVARFIARGVLGELLTEQECAEVSA